MSYILNFGRYKNSDVRNVFNKDPDYCKYLFYQPSIKLLYPEIYKFLFNSIYPDNEKEIFMEFGRYKNKPLSYIIKKKILNI